MSLNQNQGVFVLQGASPFMEFLARELQQVYMLELKTHDLIRRLSSSANYQPVKSAMRNYQKIAREHISSLRAFGLRSSNVSADNKRITLILLEPISEDLRQKRRNDRWMDIKMVTGIQRIIFYQMAVYRSLCTAARKLSKFSLASTFDLIINEKKISDYIFSEIDLSGIYPDALQGAESYHKKTKY